jgi:hypothetical protein
MLDDKLARIKKLIERREEIDAELSQLLGLTDKPRRGRQARDDATSAVNTAPAEPAVQS